MRKVDLKKTLFICDLDGTLLDTDVRLPSESARYLNILSNAGARITYSTARTIRSVSHILADAPKCFPVSLMNGAVICDMSTDGERYVSAAAITKESFAKAREKMSLAGITPFVYSLAGGVLVTSYTEITNDYMYRFMTERQERYGKKFLRLGSTEEPTGEGVYLAAMDTESKIKEGVEFMKEVSGIKCTAYRDTYEKDVWYLEVFSDKASKSASTEKLRQITKSDYIIAFGDNYNDIPMFLSSDEAYAAVSAPDEVKKCANGVFLPACQSGVVRKIAELCEIELN